MFGKLWNVFASCRKDLLVILLSLFNKRTPWTIKGLTIVALVYLISPLDLIPDFIPGVGLLEDAIIVPGVLCLVNKMLPTEVRREVDYRASRWGSRVTIILWILGILVVAWLILIFALLYKLIFN